MTLDEAIQWLEMHRDTSMRTANSTSNPTVNIHHLARQAAFQTAIYIVQDITIPAPVAGATPNNPQTKDN